MTMIGFMVTLMMIMTIMTMTKQLPETDTSSSSVEQSPDCDDWFDDGHDIYDEEDGTSSSSVGQSQSPRNVMMMMRRIGFMVTMMTNTGCFFLTGTPP